MGVAVNSGTGRARRPPRGLPGAGAGAEGEGHDARPVRRLGPGHEVLLVRRGRPRRHPGRDQPHRLDRASSATRSTCATRAAATTSGSASWTRASRTTSASTPPSDIRRIEAGIFDWGSDFGAGDQPVRGHRAGAAGRDSRTPTTSARRRSSGSAREGVLAQARRDRARRASPIEQPTQHWPALVGGEQVGHVTDAMLVAPPGEEHRVRLGADRHGRARHRLDVAADDGEREGTTAALPFIDPQKKVPAA